MTAYEAGIVAIGSATTKEAANEAYETALDNEHLSEAQENDLERAFNAKNTELDQVAAMTVYEAGIEAIGSATTEAAALTAYDTALENEHLSAEQRELLRNARDAKNAELDTVSAMTAYDTGIEAIGEAADKDAVQAAYNTAIANEHLTPAQENDLERAFNAKNAELDTVSAMTAYDTGIRAIEGAETKEAAKEAYDTASANQHLSEAQRELLQNALDDKNAEIDEATEMANETADKLNEGISPPTGRNDTPAEDRRYVSYRDNLSVLTDNIHVWNGNVGPIELSEDEATTVAALYGWEGKMYEAGNGVDGTYEAHVYSSRGQTTMGRAFNDEYTQITGGELSLASINFEESNVASSDPVFDVAAGVNWWPESQRITSTEQYLHTLVPGSYHGVSGQYRCRPGEGNRCAIKVADDGFELGTLPNNNLNADNFNPDNGAWVFIPQDPEATVSTSPSTTNYASYGWWLHKSADEETFTASAFVTTHGTVHEARNITSLRGRASYKGGAAGKYAFSPDVRDGSNDAGHFTATATLEADFNDDMISGTINGFTGADGEPRNWTVELNETSISDTGTITRLATEATTWTIDSIPANSGGEWSGSLWDNNPQGIPRLATGTFHATHGESAEMVGAFGADLCPTTPCE